MTKCVNAKFGLRINNDGSCSHCCMQRGQFSSDQIKYNVSTHSFDEILNSETSKKIRINLDNGIKNPACDYCWKEEASGRESKRLRDNKKFKELLNLDAAGPRFLDISMGTVCNIKCRTCGPFNSSQWNDEWREAGYFKGTDTQYKSFILSHNHAFDDDSLFWKEFEKNLENVEHLDFYGGEPFLVKKQWEIMKLAVDKGYSKNITVHYNTNGTIWDEKKFEILNNFKKVIIDFSIDGIFDHLTYIRYPAKWDEVLENFLKVQKIQNENANFHTSICCTVSTFNIFYIDEIMKFFSDYTKNLYLNLVHGPEQHCIKNIPESIKKIITEKIKSNSKPGWPGYYFVDSTLDFMNGNEFNDKKWKQFLSTTAWHDNYRTQSFRETFPEFYQIIREHGYEISLEK